MNRKSPVWRGQGEGLGTFARLASITCCGRFLDSDLQLLGVVALFFSSLGNPLGFLRTDTKKGYWAEGSRREVG